MGNTYDGNNLTNTMFGNSLAGSVLSPVAFRAAAADPPGDFDLWLRADTTVQKVNTSTTVGALDLVGASSQRVSRASNSELQVGAGDWWFAIRFKPNDTSGTNGIVCKNSGGTNDAEYVFNRAGLVWRLQIGDGSLTATLNGASGNVIVDEWHDLLVFYQNGSDNMQFYNGVSERPSTTFDNLNFVNAHPFSVGAWGGGFFYIDGQADDLSFGKLSSGSLTDSILRDIALFLYRGKKFADITPAQKTAWGLFSSWKLEETGGADTRVDSEGTNDLTPQNNPVGAGGFELTACEDVDSVRLWLSREGSEFPFYQDQPLKRPTLATGEIGGQDAILGKASRLLVSYETLDHTSGTVMAVCKSPSAWSGDQVILAQSDDSSGDLLEMGFDGSGRPFIEHQTGVQNRVRSTTLIPTDTEFQVIYASDGSAWSIRVDGDVQSLAIEFGSNTGDWFGDVSSAEILTTFATRTATENSFFEGHVAEIVAWTPEQSADAIDAYTRSRYGTP